MSNINEIMLVKSRGWAAAREGFPDTRCPYHPGSKMGLVWLSGWDQWHRVQGKPLPPVTTPQPSVQFITTLGGVLYVGTDKGLFSVRDDVMHPIPVSGEKP